jgi:hypothetical protein
VHECHMFHFLFKTPFILCHHHLTVSPSLIPFFFSLLLSFSLIVSPSSLFLRPLSRTFFPPPLSPAAHHHTHFYLRRSHRLPREVSHCRFSLRSRTTTSTTLVSLSLHLLCMHAFNFLIWVFL